MTSSTSTSGVDRQDRPLIAVLDYGIGNLRSAQKGLQFVGADAQLTSDKKLIADAQAVVLPGVGNFGACMTALRQAGLEESVHAAVASNRPFLGICVGMQMLFESSEESPGVKGLEIIGGEIKWLPLGLAPQTRNDSIVRRARLTQAKTPDGHQQVLCMPTPEFQRRPILQSTQV